MLSCSITVSVCPKGKEIRRSLCFCTVACVSQSVCCMRMITEYYMMLIVFNMVLYIQPLVLM